MFHKGIYRRRSIFAVTSALVCVPAAFSYIRQSYTDPSGSVLYNRPDAAGIQFLINDKIAPGEVTTSVGAPFTVVTAGSNPVAAARAALASWSNVPGSKLRFLPLKSTPAAHDSNDYQNVITFASTDDLSMLGFVPGKAVGAIAVTFNSLAPADGPLSNGVVAKKGDIIDSDIVLNASLAFSTDGTTGYDIQGVLTHELGHALGLNHSALLGASMFPYSSITTTGQDATPLLNQRFLSTDEVGFAVSSYPAANAPKLGTLSGKVIASDGSPVKFGSVTLVDSAAGASYGTLTAADGTWSHQLPAGTYNVFVQPLSLTSVVQAANIYTSSGSLDPAQTTTNFQPSMLGGSNPTAMAVTAGGTATTPDLTVTAGVSSLKLPFFNFAPAGGTGGSDIAGFPGIAGPRSLTSGQTLDLIFLGGGMDGTETIQVMGGGITLKAGTLRIIKNSNDPTSPLIRVTVDVKASQTAALASLFISKPSGTLALAGLIVVTPPKPVFTSKSVVSAASFKGVNGDGAVSAGGIYSIYDTMTTSLGPVAFAQPPGYDVYGNLATTLGGVTVTFDGVPAPLYLSYAGQLNLQVPFEVAGKSSTKVVVNFFGSQSDAVSIPVVPAQPAFFTFTPAGTDAIIQNFPDFSLNSASNPVAKGGITLLYGTGLGKLNYALATGQPGVVPPSTYASTYSCSFGGKTSSAYVYWNYGFVGEAIWTATIPADAPTGAVTFTCTDSATGASTQPGTIYVK